MILPVRNELGNATNWETRHQKNKNGVGGCARDITHKQCKLQFEIGLFAREKKLRR